MKKFLLSLVSLLMLTLFAQAGAPYKLLTFPAAGGADINGYESEWTATVDGDAWTLNGFNSYKNGWDHVRCGRKNVDQIATITSPVVDKAITHVLVSVLAVKNVNSVTLTVLNGEEVVGEPKDITESFVTGEVVTEVAGAAGYSYKLTVDSKSGANGSTQIGKVALYEEGQYVDEATHIANDAESAYTVARAIELIEAGESLSETVYVKGIVSQVDNFSDKYKSITYWISDDGTTTNQFECYSGKGIGGADFASIDDVKVGASVIVKGTMKKYNDVYEFNQSNELVSYEAPVDPSSIQNADFSSSTPLEGNLFGYGKDAGGGAYGLQDVDGWTKVVVSGDNTNKDFPNSGMGGAVFAYGSSNLMRGNQKSAPAAGPDGEAGNALGFFAVWSCGGYYYQNITLAAGTYTLLVPMYNQSGTQANESYTGFFVKDSDVKYTVAVNPTPGSWTVQSVTFTLEEETEGEIRLGYKSNGSGSAANPMLFIDGVQLMSELDGAKAQYNTALAAAQAAAADEVVTGSEKETLNQAIAANSNIDITSVEALKTAATALNEAVATFNAAKEYYQDLADLKEEIIMVNYNDRFPYASEAKKNAAIASMRGNATSADDAKAKAEAIRNAYRSFADSHALAEGVEGAVNMTDKIVNPNAESAIAEPWTLVNGEGSTGSLTVKDANQEPPTDGEGNTYAYFDGGNWSANAWNVALQQAITLPTGKYLLTVAGRASTDVAMTVFAGEVDGGIPSMGAAGGLFGRGWNNSDIEFEMTEEGEIIIGVKGVTEVIHNWMSFTRFRLVQLKAAATPTQYTVTISDEIANGTVVAAPTEAEAGETITLTITPAEGYELDQLQVLGANGAVVVVTDNTFTMPAANVRVSATFKEATSTDYTSYIKNADLSDAESTAWDTEGTKGYHSVGGVVTAARNAQFDFKQTIEALPAGKYLLSVQAAYRYGDTEQAEADAYFNDAIETKFAKLYATVGKKTVDVLVKNRYDGATDTDWADGIGSVVVEGKPVPNSTAAVKAWFDAKQYTNDLEFNLAEAGDVTIGIVKTAQPEAGDYTVIGPWTLTRLGDAEEEPVYSVTISDEIVNGTLVAEPATAEAGTKIQLTATPDDGYEFVSFKVTGNEADQIIEVAEDGTFEMPAYNVTASATFVEAAPILSITLKASEGAYAEGGSFVKEWTSNTTPIVKVTASANNMYTQVTETFQWYSGTAGSSIYTISAPINYIITSCTITAKGNSAEQTITAGEAEKTFGTADFDELVLSNLSNPSTSFTLTGANSGLLIQKIELDIAPNPNFNISNDKAYLLTTPRGSLGVSDGQLVATIKEEFTASNFAIISYNDAYYLWSVEAGRFISETGDASNYAPSPISFVALDGGKFQIRYGNKAINITSGYAPGVVIDGWTTVDPGNTYTIEAAADFDATEALAILETPITFTNKVTDLANLSNVKAYVITNARGTWNVNNGETAMTPKKFLPDATCEQFALLQMEGKNFIYSVNAKKFLNPDNTFGKPVPVNISATGNEDYPWFFSFDANHNINVSGTKILIDGWSTIDDGNSNAIIEATDFDSKDAMAALYEYFRLFADGKYYISNVGTGKYLAAGSNWGTHAVVNADGLDYDIKMADGKYTLDSQVSNGGNNHYLNGEWNDGAAMGWIFNEVSEGVYTISNGTNFLTAGENGVVSLAADASVDAAKWTLKTLADRIAELAAATAEAPVDATFLIQDANFGRNDLRKSAWTMDAENQNLSGGEDNNGSVGNNCAESYHSTFTLSQTLANAPAGKYKMTAQGFYRQDDGATEDLPVFYANDKTANFPAKTGSEGSMTDASKSFSAGQYTIEPIEVTVFENGQLTVGAKGTAVHQWVIFDNFRLSYLGSEIPAEEFAPAYDTALSNAKKALDDETYAAVTGEEKTALAAAIETYSTVDETVEAYKAAISALTAATTTFTGAKADYDALVAAKAANAERSYAYADADKKAAAEATLTVEPTSAADANEKTAAIWTAFRKYADSHALAEGVEGAINMTDYIVNPNAAEAIAEPWTVVKGEGSGGSLNILDGEPLTDGEGNTYKYFDGGDWNANAWDVALKQTITLPAGKYMITASGRASADVQLSLLVGEEKTAIPAIGATGGLFGRGWDDASKEFELSKKSEVVIGVQGVTSVIHNWMSFTRFRLVCLEKVEVPAVVLNAPTLNAENGTQAEPKMYPSDFKLMVNYSADNLEENGYNAEDLKVKVTVMVSGDLPENIMNMQSETRHSVLPTQPFYIDLGQTDFPVELKQGYVYQNIVVTSATLVKPATEVTEEVTIATYAGAPVQLHWIGIAPAVKLTVAANIESGTAEEPGTSKGFTTVEAGSEFKLLVSAENLEANGLNPEELTLEIGMVMESMFTDPGWSMGVPNTSSRIVKQNVVVPFAEEIVLEDVVFDKNFPFIQSINLAGITLKKGNETITAINEALVVRLIEVYENGAPVGIKDVKGAGEKATIYDLSGRKVEKMVKGGIYIVNGKKVSFK